MDDEQAFWFRISNPTNKPSDVSPVKIEAPKELPKVSLVNESLKKLKFHLARFDNVVKIRTTLDARIEDVLLTVMNSMSLLGESVNMDGKRKEYCDLEAELLKSQSAFNNILKRIFEKNDLKAQLQEKDSTIYKLKDIIKLLREKSKEENVNYDYGEIETKNVELENIVAKLSSKNERLCNEINHVKQVFKEQLDSIKKTRVRTKEQSNSLIDKLNLKSAENEDLKAQIQDKVFVITSLKNDLQKLKGKEIVDIAAQTPSAHTIVPGMFKHELEPLAHRIEVVQIVQLDSEMTILQGLWGLVTISLEMVLFQEYTTSRGLDITYFLLVNFVTRIWKSHFGKTLALFVIEGVDLLFGSRDTNLYTISLDDMLKTSPIYLLSKALKTKSWLWHHRLSHLNFGTLNKLAKDGLARGIPRLKFQKDHLCSACALGKSKKSSHQPKAKDTNQEKLYLLHMDLCGLMRVASINEKRRNRTLIEATRTMLIFSKASLFLWAEAINRACYTQNRSLIRRRYNKTPYKLMKDKKPDLSFFHVFGALCYPTNDNDDLGKLDAKADIGIFVGYALAKKAFRIYNKRTQKIIETIHVTFDELIAMVFEQFSSGTGLHYMTPATSSSGLVLNTVSQQPCIPPNKDDWDHLFQPMFDEYFTPISNVVSQVQKAVAPRAVDLVDSPMSTSIDQDA
ncbi:integrase, catalytic region, zinc finger, CCHC-type containing protein [Tanacetum coccineum]